AASTMMEAQRITLIVAMVCVSPLTVSSQLTWVTAPGPICEATCTKFLSIPQWVCRGITNPFQQEGACLLLEDSQGCCAGCVRGAINASPAIADLLTFVTDTITRIIGIFNPFEQALINAVIADLVGLDFFGNMENILNNVDNQIVPTTCTWGQIFATRLWSIQDVCERILDSFDGRGGVFPQPQDRDAFTRVLDLVLWFKQCLLPRLLDLSGLECFKDDLGCEGRHHTFCKPDCRCSECRTNDDCNEPDRPNCRNNRAGIMICGDPHISQTIKGAEHRRLCYDFVGKPGSAYLFFRDHEIDVKTTFIEDEDANHESFVDYIGQINVTRKDIKISISPDQVILITSECETIYQWKEDTVNLAGGLMMIGKKQIRVYFNNDTVELIVTRKGRAKGTPFLNFGVTERAGLSTNAGGIMGWIGNKAVYKDEGPHSGYITLGEVTIPVYDNKDGCLKIDEEYLDKFSSILHLFEMD
ncbi:unnamed protein product, partial [Owenia fusiformis]